MPPHPLLKRFAVASAMLLCMASLPAAAVSITNGGATINVNNTHGGVDAYVLSGTDHLFQADYYFRTGSMTAEDMMTGVNSTYVNSVTASGNEITVDGGTSEFDFTLIYRLNNQGAMVPTLDITNISGAQLDIELFNYQDWDVNGTANGDRISWNGNVMTVSQGATDITITPFTTPNAVSASAYAALRNSLRDGSATTLTDGAGLPFGPGDGTFAFQFSIGLAAGASTTVVYAVPEPSTGLLGLLGLSGLAWSSRRRAI